MGYIYDAMEKAKRSIVAAFNKESDYRAYLEVINHILEEKIHSPLHAAAYYLNPAIFYNPSFSNNKRIHKGLLDCIETLEPSLNCQDTITQHKTYYEEAVGDFSRPVAIRGRESLSPGGVFNLILYSGHKLERISGSSFSSSFSYKDFKISVINSTHNVLHFLYSYMVVAICIRLPRTAALRY